MTLWEILGAVVAAIVVLVIGFLLGIMYRKKVAEREISSAEEEAKRIINESIKAAESKKTRGPGRSARRDTQEPHGI